MVSLEKVYDMGYNDGYEQGKKDATQWISVNDRLPYDGEKVLVYLSNKNISIGWYVTNRDGARGFELSYGFVLIDYFTHWMPLPEPPKGE